MSTETKPPLLGRRTSLRHYTTSMMVVLLCVMVGSGLLLSVYPTPQPSTPSLQPQASVPSPQLPEAQRPSGPAAYLHTVHAFSAGLLVATTLLHLLSLFIGRVWRSIGLRLSGIALLVAILGAAYTGSILPWDALGKEAAQIGTGLLEQGVPLIGETLATIARGGDYVGDATHFRMRSFHTSWFPVIIILLLVLHLAHLRRIPVVPASAWAKREPMLAGMVAVALPIVHVVSGRGIDDMALQFGLILLPPLITWYAVALVDDPARDAKCDTVWRDLFCALLTGAMIVTVAALATWERHPTVMAPEWYLYPPYLLLNTVSAGWVMAIGAAMVVLGVVVRSRE